MSQSKFGGDIENYLATRKYFDQTISTWTNTDLQRTNTNKPVASVIIFNFDKTMIKEHTYGVWSHLNHETTDEINNLKKLFHLLRNYNCQIFINTRGIVKQTSPEGINYGIYFFLEQYNLLSYVNYISGNSQQLNAREWSIKKKCINKEIYEMTGVSPKKVFFLDDSKLNIEASNSLGIHCIQIDNDATVTSQKIAKEISSIISNDLVQPGLSKLLITNREKWFGKTSKNLLKLLKSTNTGTQVAENDTISIERILSILEFFESTKQKEILHFRLSIIFLLIFIIITLVVLVYSIYLFFKKRKKTSSPQKHNTRSYLLSVMLSCLSLFFIFSFFVWLTCVSRIF